MEITPKDLDLSFKFHFSSSIINVNRMVRKFWSKLLLTHRMYLFFLEKAWDIVYETVVWIQYYIGSSFLNSSPVKAHPIGIKYHERKIHRYTVCSTCSIMAFDGAYIVMKTSAKCWEKTNTEEKWKQKINKISRNTGEVHVLTLQKQVLTKKFFQGFVFSLQAKIY